MEYLDLSIERMVTSHKSDEVYDDNKNKQILVVLKEIEKNQTWNIQKIK
jgi:hypothetical protein